MAYTKALNEFSRPIALLAELVAASLEFQGEVLAANPTLAMAKICYPYAPDRVGELVGRPRAIVEGYAAWAARKHGTVFAGTDGMAVVSFELGTTEATPREPGNEFMDFLNRVGDILVEMQVRASSERTASEKILVDGDYSHLAISGIELIDGPGECERSNEDNTLFYGATFAVGWNK